MQRYHIPSRYLEGDGVNFSGESTEMARYTDAEEAIAKARRDERDRWLDSNVHGIAWDALEKIKGNVLAEERKRIVRELGGILFAYGNRETDNAVRVFRHEVFRRIAARGEPKCTCHGPCRCNGSRKDPEPCDCYPSHPKPLVKLRDVFGDGVDMIDIVKTINALVDAVNEIRRNQ